MSIASQITRIQQDRNTIRTKMVELGLATSVDNLDVLAEAVDSIENKGSVSVNVKEGETYTIPKGYHSGSGTVSGVAGGGNYSLQSKPAITPTKKQQQITPDDGYYGLSDVTIGAIPDAYQDVTSVTAGAGDVLTGKVIVSSTGVVTAGTMPDNGTVDKTLTTTDASYTVPAGKHSGTGTIKIIPEDKSVTPTKTIQDIVASNGKVLNKVSVAAIPAEYQVVTPVTAESADVLTGKTIVDAEGNVVDGTMVNNGAVSTTLDATSGKQSYTVPQGYHDGAGAVSIALEEKSATPTKAAQDITPTDGKVLSKVSVAPIPDEYQDVTPVTAGAADVLTGKKIVDAEGNVVDGTMADNGAAGAELYYDMYTGDGTSASSYTISKGYHNGEGKVTVDAESKNVTPKKSQQVVRGTRRSMSGYDYKFLTQVVVEPIPDEYQDVTPVTAGAGDVLTGKKIVDATGAVIEGVMADNGTVSKTLTVADPSYTVPAGKHSGEGIINIIPENKAVTPTKSAQDIIASNGKVLSKVTVNPIPNAYQDVTGVTTTADKVLTGSTFVDSTGAAIEGSMANNAAVTATVDGMTTLSYTIPAGYHNGSGTVSLTSDIEDALAAI